MLEVSFKPAEAGTQGRDIIIDQGYGGGWQQGFALMVDSALLEGSEAHFQLFNSFLQLPMLFFFLLGCSSRWFFR